MAPTARFVSFAPYASDPARSRGRLHGLSPSPTRSEFQRDRDRVIHSTAFRRLKHKTQVFVYHEGDHYRTRLTHTIEVSQIARAVARALGLDEDLAEAVALAHDLGHPPFGHAGEDALDARMAAYGGFDHNAQSLRVVTRLEAHYADYDGLNLTWETLEGIVKHNGPLLPLAPGAHLPHAIVDYQNCQDLDLASHAGPEAQAAAIADDIAYDAHDVDDGLRAGLFGMDELEAVPLLGDILAEVRSAHPGGEPARLGHEVVRRIITRLIEDAIAESRARLADAAPADADAVRRAGRSLVGFSPAMAEREAGLKAFLYRNMYRHPDVVHVREAACRVLDALFGRYMEKPDLLPPEWRRGLAIADEAETARRICDYIAGMTDRFALDEHRRLFDATPDLR